MVPRFTEFYIPVLHVLSDVEKKEVNALIDAVADFVGLTDGDRKITTRSGNQPRYRSNIQWAITDLAQAGFIERPNRAHYLINIDGLAMLEDNPINPDREYLASRSEKFKAFLEKRGTRPRKPNDNSDQLPFEMEDTSDGEEVDEDEIKISLNKLYQIKRISEENGYSIDDKLLQDIDKLEKEALLNIPDWAVNTMPIRTEVDDYTGSFTVLVEYKNNEMVGAGVSKNFPAIENSDYYIDARREYPELFEDKGAKNDSGNSQSSQASDLGVRHQTSVQPPKRKKNSILKVTMPNGKVLSDGSATEILVYVIEYVGPERVATLGLTCAGMPLVSKHRPPKYSYRELSKGYFLTTNSPTSYKKQYIDTIASALHLNILAEVVD